MRRFFCSMSFESNQVTWGEIAPDGVLYKLNRAVVPTKCTNRTGAVKGVQDILDRVITAFDGVEVLDGNTVEVRVLVTTRTRAETFTFHKDETSWLMTIPEGQALWPKAELPAFRLVRH